MEKLVDQGLVKHIGISNFSVKKIKDLLSYARIKPAVNQIEVHPYFRNDYNIKYCSSQVSPHGFQAPRQLALYVARRAACDKGFYIYFGRAFYATSFRCKECC